MKEEFLHYVWQQELCKKNIVSVDGHKIEIISPGLHNTDAGPDFTNARLKIDDTIWAGNIEIHTNSADWQKHNHHTDAAYNNVILHIVDTYCAPVFCQNGQKIPTATLSYSPKLFSKYNELDKSAYKIACQNDFDKVDDFNVKMWLERLCIERLENKADYVKDTLSYTNNNWEDAFYIVLARNFGFKTNALPFELLAKSIPHKLLAKYHHNLVQLEALLFGQAGLLEKNIEDEYFDSLKKEYTYLRNAHKLTPLDNHIWKFLRLRPTNFPTIRIAQFASLVNNSEHLFSKTIETKNIEELRDLFDCKVSKYWETHYTFGKTSKPRTKQIGKSALNGIFINTVIPFLFIFGKLRAKEDLMDKALQLLSSIPAEKNSIARKWETLHIKAVNAADSQALIQLYNYYCSQKNCLYCEIGNTIIRKQINEEGYL